MRRFIGVDLHKNMFISCFYTENQEKEVLKYDLKKIDSFINKLLPDDEIAVECTTNSHYFVGKVRDFVSDVKVVNPYKFKIISESVSKTDYKDAEALAFYLSKGMLPEVRMKGENYRKIEALCKLRDSLVKSRTEMKNKIHNTLTSCGINKKRDYFSSKKRLLEILHFDIDEISKELISQCVEMIMIYNERIKNLEGKITEYGENLSGFENLTSIKGIGKLGAIIILCSIGGINNFPSPKKLNAYFGIVPRVSVSNETVHHGKITRHGNKLARTTLVQCAMIAIKYSGYLKEFYLKLRNKKGHGKAIIACARKLLNIIYDTLKNNWIFEDFPNFVLKNS